MANLQRASLVESLLPHSISFIPMIMAAFFMLQSGRVFAEEATEWLFFNNKENCATEIRDKWKPYISTIVATWSGKCKNGRASGEGELVITYKNDEGEYRESYNGPIIDGFRDGRGIYSDSYGNDVDGFFKHGNFIEGYGKWNINKNLRYEGQFQKGDRNGFGKLVWSNGASVKGNFENGSLKGRGIYTSPNGDIEFVKQVGTNFVKAESEKSQLTPEVQEAIEKKKLLDKKIEDIQRQQDAIAKKYLK